jgi:hypothetical protein
MSIKHKHFANGFFPGYLIFSPYFKHMTRWKNRSSCETCKNVELNLITKQFLLLTPHSGVISSINLANILEQKPVTVGYDQKSKKSKKAPKWPILRVSL